MPSILIVVKPARRGAMLACEQSGRNRLGAIAFIDRFGPKADRQKQMALILLTTGKRRSPAAEKLGLGLLIRVA